MKGKIGDSQRLLHILESISEIEKYTTNVSLEEFLENSMMRFASIKQIEIIGEAANYISEETKNKFTDIQWRQIIGMRHILVHEYFGIDSQLIWQIIIDDLPKLKNAVQTVISAEGSD
ncbi:MAG: DUF86 domain-containing protein [Bacteroidota bacterium]